ncbi:MAG: class IV adenylate cyclase [Patescibacteria group bacterium]
MNNREIEVRFLEIDKQLLIKKLSDLGAQDHGEDLLEEIIFYDKDHKWPDEGKFVRIRKDSKGVLLSYKHHQSENINGVEEIEFGITDSEQAKVFLEKLGLIVFRYQQKKRHSFTLNGVTVDIDTWPKIPTYLELEGSSELELKEAAGKLQLDWQEVVFKSARTIIEEQYHIPVSSMKWFTFDKFE